MLSRSSTVILTSALLLSTLSGILVAANPATGNFTMSVQGYTVTGTLTDITGHQSGVRLLMSIDQSFSTTTGSVHIVADGVWNGEITDSIIRGSIDEVNGSVHACALFVCQDLSFSGSGNWTGTVTIHSGLPQGSGTFQGVLNFSNLTPSTVSGNWTSTLNI